MHDEGRTPEQLIRQAEEGRQLLDRLYRVAIAMQASWEREDRLQAFIRAVHEVIGFDRFWVLLASPDGSHFELAATYGQAPPPSLPLSPAAGPLRPAGDRSVRRSLSPLPCSARSAPPPWRRPACMPRPVREATQLYEITAQLASNLDVDRILDLITMQAVELLGCDASAILQYDAAQGGLTGAREHNLAPELKRDVVLRPGEGIGGRVFQERRPVWTRDLLAHSSLTYDDATTDRIIKASTPRAILAAPIISREDVNGVLLVYCYTPGILSRKRCNGAHPLLL